MCTHIYIACVPSPSLGWYGLLTPEPVPLKNPIIQQKQQVRQLTNGGHHANNADQNDAAMMMDDAAGNNNAAGRVCGKRGALDDGEQAAPQRVRGPVFTDVVNHMQH